MAVYHIQYGIVTLGYIEIIICIDIGAESTGSSSNPKDSWRSNSGAQSALDTRYRVLRPDAIAHLFVNNCLP